MTVTEHIQPFRAALASDWQSALQRDEWFFSNLEEDIAKRLSSSEAFTAIDEVAQLLLQQHEPMLRYFCGVFLLGLISRSDTTELPCGLRNDWAAVQQLLSDHPDIAAELRNWYRQP